MLKKYDWIEKEITTFPIPEPQETIDLCMRRETKIESTIDSINLSEKLPIIAELFLASALMSEPPSLPLSFLIPSQKVMDQIIQEIAPFFETAKQIDFGSTSLPFEISLEHPKEETMRIFDHLKNTGTLNPIVASLYSPVTTDLLQPPPHLHLKVAGERIAFYENQEFDQALLFLKEYFLHKHHQIVLTPHSWIYNDELQHNPALRYFAAFFEHVILSIVDGSNKVAFLTLY